MEQTQQKSSNSDGAEKKPESIPSSLSSQIKDWVQILAILVGGGWALYVWLSRDWPALALRQKAESKVSWAHRQNDTIHAEYFVTMTNGGSTPFTITRTHLRVWILDKSVAFAKDSGFLDANRFIRNGRTPIFDTNFIERNDMDTLDAPFCQEYEPGAMWSENFDFPIILDTTKMALFLVQFYKKGKTKPFDWTYFWDPVGGDSVYPKDRRTNGGFGSTPTNLRILVPK
jgi:hypothetical protein